MIRGLMSDEEWSCLEPFVIERGARSGRRSRNHGLVLDGIFWVARTGVAWRDLHEHFGKWSSVYRQFRRWTLSGLWELVLEAFNDSGGGNPSLHMIDSTIIRATLVQPALKGCQTACKRDPFWSEIGVEQGPPLRAGMKAVRQSG